MRKIHASGQRVTDRYLIINYLAEGGMQEVYKAMDSHIGREVALKTPKNASASKRFRDSALASSKVNHANVARTLDYFVHEDREYLIEEFIQGDTLADVFSKNYFNLDPLLVAHIGIHLARGIQASHRVGVIHRDLKPNNIMVSGGISFQSIKITDFGVAKLVDDEFSKGDGEDVSSSILASKTLIGAVPYMAPEILLDSSSQPTLASDIWAFGAMLYHLMAGKTPYTMDLAKVIIAYSQKKPLADIEHINSMAHLSSLSQALVDIIQSCMNYEPAKRPSAENLVESFSSLCFSSSERNIGVVNKRFGHGENGFGFINQNGIGSSVFFHMEEVYGTKPIIGDKVCYSSFEGDPRERAFPIIKCK